MLPAILPMLRLLRCASVLLCFVVATLLPLALAAQPGEMANEAGLANAYYLERDYARALPLYEKLFQRDPDAEIYLYRIVESHQQLKQPDLAVEFLRKQWRLRPERLQYAVLLARTLDQAGRSDEARKTYEEVVARIRTPLDAQLAGGALFRYRKLDEAAQAFRKGRQLSGDPADFSIELASVYRLQGDYAAAVQELLQYYRSRPQKLPQVQLELMRLVTENNHDAIEAALLQATQRHNDDTGLRELLYQFYLRIEDYDQAILLARSMDRLNREDGARIYKLAVTLQHSNEFDRSNRALDYLITQHEGSPYQLSAYFERAKNYELKAFAQRPLDTASIRQAVAHYDALFDQFGRRDRFAEAILRKARLQVFYLGQMKEAVAELRVLEDMRITPQDRAQARLLLGDVYLLQADYPKALLAYQQVEEALPDAQEGAEAKYRMARVAYFKGDFELAKARLRTLKDNTSDDIANDAINLFLTIQENTGLDSSTTPLRQFARAQLLNYQHAHQPALDVLDSILTAYPMHPLTDNALWEKAQILLGWGRIGQVLPLLDRILEQFPNDLLADDALFLKAELTERHLADPQAAQTLYLDLLTNYPGSLLKVEARRRIRLLRGETVQ